MQNQILNRVSEPVGRGISFMVIALTIVVMYWLTSQDATQGVLLMPLDDVYIHFQYARQLALGEPYVYNPGGLPTSGATSLLYPFLLATGYLIGFQGLNLGLWAMLLGAIALIATMEALFRLCRVFDIPDEIALWVAWLFGLTGTFHWHFMSGMETGIVTALLLWVLLGVLQKNLRLMVFVATLLAMMRPEGGVWAGIACGAMFFHLWADTTKSRQKLLWLAVPIFAVGVQPLINRLVTDSSVATGNQAKSILATIPQDWGVILTRILDNVSRMWLEFFTGYGEQGWYVPPLLGLFAVVAVVLMLIRRGNRWVGLMVLGWLLAGTAAISTLDTAFWHFKRYQIPMMALFVPMVTYLAVSIWQVGPLKRFKSLSLAPYAGVCVIFAIGLSAQFLVYHRANVGYVYQQPYQMALWLRDNTPEGSVVAVHDVGLMRYMGERETLDMVGLTTPNAAQSWRNGPGSVAEFLINQQPNYIASYGVGHGYGLRFLAETSLYGEPLAEFPIDNWQSHLNVALAANYQAIYAQPAHLAQSILIDVPTSFQSFGEPQILDVANLDAESQFDYEWQSIDMVGFTTEYHAFDVVAHGIDCEVQSCPVEEAFRKINQAEKFVLRGLNPNEGALLQTLVQPAVAGQLEIFVADVYVDTQWLPAQPGTWHVITTYLPPEQIDAPEVVIEFRPMLANGFYMPALHIIQQGNMDTLPVANNLATYQEGAAVLIDVVFQETGTAASALDISLTLQTDSRTAGDYRFFVHLYEDVNQAPVSQFDGYWLDMPFGNLLQGVWTQSVRLPLAALESGEYQLAMGFYNPNNPTDRLVPVSNVYDVSDDGRLWLGGVIIE